MEGAKYWKKRSIKRSLTAEKQAEQYQKQIARIYRKAEKQIQSDINDVYRSYAKGTGIDVDKLLEKLSFDDTTKHWLKMKKDGNLEYITKNYKSRINRLEQIQGELYSKIHDIRNDEVVLQTKSHTEVANETYNRTVFDTQQGVGQPIAFGGLTQNNLDKVLQSNWQGANYSNRIWSNTDRLATTVRDELGSALLTGKSRRRVSREVAERFDVANHVADRLIRTETNYIQNQVEADVNEEMGFERYVYVAVLDSRTSQICGVTDKLIFKLAYKKVGVNYPPLHPNCRSTTRVYLGKEFEPKTRRAKDVDGNTIEIENMSYKKWKKAYGIDDVQPTTIPEANAKTKNVTNKEYVGVKKTREMNPAVAVKANPRYGEKGGKYNTNCQKTVPTYELRRRGFNLEALPRDKNSHFFDNNLKLPSAWGAKDMDFKGYEVKNGRVVTKPIGDMIKKLNEYPEGARIQMNYSYTRRKSGHTIVVEKVPKSEQYPQGVMFVDPQPGKITSKFDPKGKHKFSLLRLDNRDIEPGLVDFIAKPKGKR